MSILAAGSVSFAVEVPLAIIGGGACGMAAALAASDAGVDPLILERDSKPAGSTALSAGMIPACGTRQQTLHAIDDNAELMASDILNKANQQNDARLVRAICDASGPMIDWLCETHGVELTLVKGFLYPGHSRLRMHAPPSRSGADLISGLSRAAEAADITIMTDAQVTHLVADERGLVAGLQIQRPDGSTELIGCGAIILACSGYAGNPDMVSRYIPQMADALYFGHPGNQGDALVWGLELGAATCHLGAYQGHGSVAFPHGILISWALMMEGGILINTQGERFSNEHEGYSEQARYVIAQPQGLAWSVYDSRLHDLQRDFEDYRRAEAQGAVKIASDVEQLARITDIPFDRLRETIEQVAQMTAGQGDDVYGRDFTTRPSLKPPYYAILVTGALFHTQGGLVVDGDARVQRQNGGAFSNLFAGGGAACGVSGPQDWGYLSGNGLLTALTLGRNAGTNAARS